MENGRGAEAPRSKVPRCRSAGVELVTPLPSYPPPSYPLRLRSSSPLLLRSSTPPLVFPSARLPLYLVSLAAHDYAYR